MAEVGTPSVAPPADLEEKRRRLLTLLLKEQGVNPLRAPILPLPRERTEFPLSLAQERLWIIQEIDPGNAAYNLPTALKLAGRLRRGLLERTLAEVVRRHSALRTTFGAVAGRPVQRIRPPGPVAIPLIDLAALPLVRRDETARRLAEEDAGLPFDLAKGVLRATLIRLSSSAAGGAAGGRSGEEEEHASKEEEHALLFTVHHIASDGWSSGVLVGEVAALYAAFASGRPSPLPELPVQYVDYAAWQRQALQGETLAAAIEHWRKRLRGGRLGEGSPVLELPADRPRPAVQGFAGATVYAQLPAALGEGLKALAREQGATLFMSTLAGFQGLLARWTGETDVAVGTPVAGRDRTEVEGLIGFFVNTLVLRDDLGGDPAFRALVVRAREVAVDAFAHADLPFGKLVAELNPERSLAHAPFFQVMFVLQNAPTGGVLELPGLRLAPLEAEAQTAIFDITLALTDRPGGLLASFHYRTELFDAATAQRLLGHYVNLLAAAAKAPDRRLSELPLLGEAERQAVLLEWNDSAAAYPLEGTLGSWIAQQAARTPDAVAVAFASQALSYGDLLARADRLAGHLRRLGVGPDVPVGIAMERSLELLIALVAALRAGGAYVPLDPAYPSERLAQMAADAQPPVLLTQQHLAGELPDSAAHVLVLDGPGVQDRGSVGPRDAPDSLLETGPDHLAYALFTSGSTGRPKGAMNTHRAILNRLLWMLERYGLAAGDRVLQKTPISFDVSVWELFWPLLAGARLVVARPGIHAEPDQLARAIVEEEITVVHFVPSVLASFLEEPGARLCVSLRQVVASGEALPFPLAQRFFRRLPGSALDNLYGPTEAAVDVTWWSCDPAAERPPVPIGRPVANTRIHLLDTGHQPAPIGVPGELAIAGVQPARGYLGRPDLTAERFAPDPASASTADPGGVSSGRLYRTGDRARRLPTGAIEYLGRLDGQVKVRGVRIELGEIETSLAQHPGVAEAAVVVREGASGSPADRRLVAYAVPSVEGAGPLRRRLAMEREGRLPGPVLELPNGLAIAHLNRGETEMLYREIFVERAYLRQGIEIAPGDVVVDAGANIGLFSLLAGLLAPGGRIYAFEPVPRTFAALAANVELHGLPARLFPRGLAAVPGTGELIFYPHLSLISGRFANAAADRTAVRSFLAGQAGATEAGTDVEAVLDDLLESERVTCELTTVSHLIREEGLARIDLLKVDVERSEAEVLAGIAEEHWPRIRQVVAEVHDVAGRLAALTDLLRARGFEVAVEQEAELGETPLYNLYARRPGPPRAASGSTLPAASGSTLPALLWSSAERLGEDVRATLARKLPEAMVPAAVVWMEELPRTPSGKVDRRALATRGPAPRAAEVEQVVPRTASEELVAGIWSEVLGFRGRPGSPAARPISARDNFFDLGGHSLLASQVAARLREAVGVDLPLRRLFEAPTVETLAAAVDAAQAQVGAAPLRPPLVPVSRGGRLALSFAQERLWFLDRLEPGGFAYNVPAAIRLSGRLDRGALAGALREVVRRHEVLRTAYGADLEGPVARVLPPEAPGALPALPVADLSALPAGPREDETRRLVAEESRRPFDLERGPVLRAILLRLAKPPGEEEHALLLTLHHIASDAWSTGVLVGEVAALYGSLTAGRPSPLPPLPVQYADFAAWQRRWLTGAELDSQLAWWRSQLAGVPQALDLPADRQRPPVPSLRGAHRWQALPGPVAAAVRALGRRSGTTLFMTLLAGFVAQLHRETGEPVLLVGTTLAQRDRRELEGLIGFLINTLPLRGDADGDPTFGELLARAKETALASFAHGDVPFERIVEEVGTARDFYRSPLVQVFFQVQNAPQGTAAELPGLRLSPLDGEGESAKLDLVVNVGETTDGFGIGADWVYAVDLFDGATVGRLAAHFENVVATAVADPGRRLSELPLLGAAERHQLVTEWGERRSFDPGTKALHEVFAARAAERPDAVALVVPGERVTYGTLAARAGVIAARLRALGVGRGTPVALFLERSPDLVAAILGTLAAGGAYVPLDPAYPVERLATILEGSAAPVVLTQSSLAARVPAPRLPVPPARILRLDEDVPRSGEPRPMPQQQPATGPDDLAYVIYTSGSTGTPKGVMVHHGDVLRLLAATRPWFGFDGGDVWTLFHSYAFDFSVWELWGALAHGGTLVVVPFAVSRSPRDFYSLVAEEGVTVLNQTPSAFRQLLWAEEQAPEAGATEAGAAPSLAALRWVVFGGEALEPASLAPWFARHGDQRPVLVNMYGITETTVHVTGRPLRREDAAGAGSAVGRAIPDQSVHLLDATLQPVPIGAPGEIHVGGAGLARGYLGRPDLTAERFLPDPVAGGRLYRSGGSRLYRSGDLARWLPDGSLDYLGRIDHQVKVRGFRIELAEIEAALSRHPAVREVAVLVRDTGPGERSLVAFVATGEDPAAAPGLPELRAFLAPTLPDYMLPGGLVRLDRLPLTPNGKVDRRALASLDAGADRAAPEATYEPPVSPLEGFLAGLFQETLKVERVGRHDDFFALGGNSISGAVLINRLQEALGEIVQVVVIFDAPTVSQLAGYLTREHRQAVARRWGAGEGAPSGVLAVESQPRVDASRLAELDALLGELPPLPAEPGRNPRAIFVLAPPRSGTTLLRVMLGGHPALFAPPELELLGFSTLAERQAAFTGRDAFWLEGAIRAVMEARGCDVEKARALLEEGERKGWSTRRFYGLLQEWIHGRVLVDKTPSYALDRRVLARAEEAFAEPLYLHLVRHPRAVVRSFEEAKLDQLFFRRPHPFGRRELAELVWLASQRNVLDFLAGVPAERQHRVVFENMVREPERVMREVCGFLGLPYEPAMVRPYEDSAARMTDGLHAASRMLGDVKFHQHQGVDAAAAESWRKDREAIELGDLTLEMAVRLGYEDEPRREPARALGAIAAVGGAEAPLSFAQERLWFLDRLEPGSAVYNVPFALRLRGSLAPAALEGALGEIARRHASLRTTIGLARGAPVQRVSPDAHLPLPQVDLSGLPPARRDAEALALAAAEGLRAFDLERGPLARALLLALDREDHAVLLTLHHIVSDGWSMGVLVRELVALYGARISGQPAALPALPLQYGDFARWQRARLAGEALEREIAWWAGTLSGVSTLDLPADRPRPPVLSSRGAARAALMLDAAGRDRLLSLAEQQGATLFMALVAGAGALLARLSSQGDVPLGTPIAGRTRPEVNGLIGFFVNTLVLRLDLADDPPFAEALQRARRVALDAFAHQEVPFEKLAAALKPERDRSRTPLFQVMLTLQNATAEVLALPGLAIEHLPVEGETAKFDLTLEAQDIPEGLVASAVFRTDLFTPATALRLLEHLRALLAGALAAPETRISDLPLLSASERHQVTAEWGGAMETAAAAEPVPQRLERVLAEAPDAVAVEMAGEALTRGELDCRAARLAARLHRAGVGREVRVGLLAERSSALSVALLGIWRVGGAYVPLEPALPTARLAWMIEDGLGQDSLGADGVLLVEESLRGRLAELPARRVVWLGEGTSPESDAEAARSEPAGPAPASTDLAYLIYTSGSTGRPKAVAVEHGSLAHTLSAAEEAFGLRPGERMACLAPFSFDIFLFELLAPLLAGGTAVLFGLKPTVDLTAVAEGLPALDHLSAVPALMRQLAAAASRQGGVPAARRAFVGGDAVPADLLAALREAYPRALPTVLYGPTEGTILASGGAPGEGDFVGTPLARPLPGTALLPCDPAGEPVPVGVAGELWIGGPGLARGYLGRPELTAAAWRPRADGDTGGRWYRTGDLARWRPDGRLEFLGRLDSQVKVRGFRIELGEVEAALAAHPGVAEAAVLPRRGERGEEGLAAYVVPRSGVAFDPAELARHAAGRLPEYMIPAAWATLGALPLTPHGKVDRRALAALETAALHGEGDAGSPPSTPAELEVAAVWAEVLGRAPRGVAESFFAAGGDSIQAALFVNLLQERLGVSLPVAVLFEAPTVAGLARGLTEQGLAEAAMPEAGREPLRPAPWHEGEALPLSFAQERLWFIDRLEPGTASYNIPTALRLEGDLDERALAASLAEILRRHASLRTRFGVSKGRPAQVVAAVLPFVLPRVDLSALAEVLRAEETRRLATAEAGRPFDLGRGPVFRATLLRLGPADHAVLFNVHHIVSDGWSMGVLTHELSTLYAAFAAGRPSPLPDLPVQYVDFARWQRRRLSGARLEAEADFWRQALAGAPPLDLPTDFPRPPVLGLHGASRSRFLPGDLAARLSSLAERQGATLFMALLAGLAALLGRRSGQRDVSLGFPIAGRTRPEIEGLIGFFVNTLVLRTDLAGEPSFTDLLARVRRSAIAAFAHQELPFEKIVEVLQPERDRGRTPLFQTLFALQNVRAEAVELPGLRLSPIAYESDAVKFDLAVSAQEMPDSLLLAASFRTDLFLPATVLRLLAHFEALLAGALEEPERPVGDLPLLSAPERHQVLIGWNDRPQPVPAAATLDGLLALQARERPDAVAAEGGDQRLTWAELDRQVTILARALAALGAERETRRGSEVRIAACLGRSPRWLVALLATLRSGSVWVPLDPGYPRERLAVQLADSGAALVLTEPELVPHLPEERPRTLVFAGSGLPRIRSGEGEPDPGRSLRGSPLDGEALAYVIFTSGSTGRPKGMGVPHAGLAPLAVSFAAALGVGPGDRLLQFASPGFDACLAEVGAALAAGIPLRFAARDELIPGPPLSGLVREAGISAAVLPPAALGAMSSRELPGLQQLLVGGEAYSADRADAWSEGRRFYNGYGPTETTICVLVGEHPVGERPLSLGRPIAGAQLYVVDAEMRPQPAGVPGELLIGGRPVARGYLGRPDLTAGAFVPDPFAERSRLYRSGDLVRWLPDGRLEFLGRIDRQVKVRGFRVEPGEVEAVLARHPAVREAAVEAHAERGELSLRRLVAYLTVDPERRPGVEELRAFLAPHLPEHMIPSVWTFLAELPKTSSGKIDRRALPAPERDRPDLAGSRYVAPRTDLERAIAGLWQELLGLDRVGVEDSFFDLGGTSLQGALLMNLLRERLGVELPVAALFEAPTVAGLARLAAQEGPARAGGPLVALRAGGAGRPIFWIHPVGGNVHCYAGLAGLLGDRPVYGLQSLGLEGGEPQERIEVMAATYLAALQAVQPQGPYLLGGWSLGGIVAYEMSRQLAQRGERVDLLALVDAPVPGTAEIPPPQDEVELLGAMMRDLAGMAGAGGAGVGGGFDLSAADLSDVPTEERLPALLRRAEEAGALPPGVGVEGVRRLLRVFAANLAAVNRYTPAADEPASPAAVEAPASPAVALYFRAADRPSPDPVPGWRALLGPVLEPATLPADHYSLLREPAVRALAEAIEASAQRAT